MEQETSFFVVSPFSGGVTHEVLSHIPMLDAYLSLRVLGPVERGEAWPKFSQIDRYFV